MAKKRRKQSPAQHWQPIITFSIQTILESVKLANKIEILFPWGELPLDFPRDNTPNYMLPHDIVETTAEKALLWLHEHGYTKWTSALLRAGRAKYLDTVRRMVTSGDRQLNGFLEEFLEDID